MAQNTTATMKPNKASCVPVKAEFKPHARMEEKIRDRAYQIYQARNGSGIHGDAIADWAAAESEVTASGNGDLKPEASKSEYASSACDRDDSRTASMRGELASSHA